jgi:hypothetical protein
MTRSFGGSLRAAWPRHRRRIAIALLGSLTLGLAPFYPHAHVWKQLVNLARGTLTQPIDAFDLLLHGAPWLALLFTTIHFAFDAARGRA